MRLELMQLMLLTDLWKDDARWQANVLASVGKDAYTWGTDPDAGAAVLQEFACADLEFVDTSNLQVYDFMGSEHEEERFYSHDLEGRPVFKDTATGRLWIAPWDNMEAF